MQLTIDTNHISERDMRVLSIVLDLLADEMKKPRNLTSAPLHPNDHPAIGQNGAATPSVDTATMFAGNAQAGATVDTAAMFGGSTSAQGQGPAAPGLQAGAGQLTQQGAGSAAGAPTNVVAGERDSEGYPWDERIHSSSKKKTDGGAWILKKGINNDKAKLNRVKAELMQLMAQPVGAPAQQTNPAPVFQQAPQQQPAAAAAPMQQPATLQNQMQQAGMIPTQQLVPQTPQPSNVANANPQTLPELMTLVGPMIANGTLPPDALNTVVAQLGLPSMVALATTHTAMVPTAWALLKR